MYVKYISKSHTPITSYISNYFLPRKGKPSVDIFVRICVSSKTPRQFEKEGVNFSLFAICWGIGFLKEEGFTI